MISKETDNFENQAETSNTSDHQNASKNSFKPSSSSSTTSWSRFKDPRIVRVSKALGGKDRHSKVCTVRGLRDRRVRLSVPTAIQLYDLQERLGLNQPSKVVDWLLNAAKHEIDELPPLQIPQGIFSTHENLFNFQKFRASQSDKQGLWIDSNVEHSRSDFYHGKSKDSEVSHDGDDENWARNQEERQFHHLENNNATYNSIFRLDPSNLTLSSQQPPRISHNYITAQHEDWHNFELLPLQVPTMSNVPSTSHHHNHHHQVVMYHHHPGLISTQSYFPSQIALTNNGEFDPNQVNFQSSQLSTSSLSSTVGSTSQLVRGVDFNMTANRLPSQDNNDGNQ